MMAIQITNKGEGIAGPQTPDRTADIDVSKQ